MIESVLRWTSSLLALFLVGPLLALLMRKLQATDGSHYVSLMSSSSPAKGLVFGAVVILGACVFGVIVGKVVTKGTALATAGCVVLWSAWQLGTVDQIVRTSTGNPLVTLAIEGLAVGLLGVLIAGVIESLSKPAKQTIKQVFADPLGDSAFYAAIFAGILVGGFVVWFVGYQMIKGQALFAAFIGAIGAGAATQLTAMMMGKEPRAIAGYLAIAVLAAVAPIAAMFLHGEGLQAAIRSGPNGFFGAAVPVSLDWVVGMLLGVPVGQSWAGSMVEKRMQAQS